MGVLKNKIPWDLRQRGMRDSNRHAEKIKKAIKENLHNIIAQEDIISTDGKRTTRVPVKYLDSFYFKHGLPKDGIGHGDGEPGDVIKPGGKGGQGTGKGNKAGNKAGADIYEAEISVEELTQMMLEDLGLPWLEQKEKKAIITRETVFTDLRKKGIMSNWAKRKTVMENIKRNATEQGKPYFGDLKQEDMRFRTWDEKIERHSNAVIYLMMDRSGSMDDHKRYLCKAVFWWICRFLETKYDYVDVIFIAHDADAEIVPEKDFFELSNDGGTVCSSAYELCWQDIKNSRPASMWNVYCFHFSDGDNWGDDNEKCSKIIQEMLGRVNMFAYGEVAWHNEEWSQESKLRSTLKKITHPRMMTSVLYDKGDVYKTLQKFLSKDMGKSAMPDKEEEKKEESEVPKP